MIHSLKHKTNLIYIAIAALVILMLVFGKSGKKDIDTLEKELGLAQENNAGSGILEAKTFPSDADIYVDGIFSGKTPDPLYNIPSGAHNIAIKKSGYEDYIAVADIKAGKKFFIEANLIEEVAENQKYAEPKTAEEPMIAEVQGSIEVKEIKEPEDKNTIKIREKQLFYYDFSNQRFADTRHPDSDVFSRRFDTYFVFTRFNPVNIKAIGKKIRDVTKEDCAAAAGTFEYLHSGGSLCIVTKGGQIAAIGGYWERTENEELEYKVFD